MTARRPRHQRRERLRDAVAVTVVLEGSTLDLLEAEANAKGTSLSSVVRSYLPAGEVTP